MFLKVFVILEINQDKWINTFINNTTSSKVMNFYVLLLLNERLLRMYPQ